MLVCDHCHVKCCHIDCLIPAIEEIPFEPWYCDYCIHNLGVRSTLPTANIFLAIQRNETNRRRRLRREGQRNRDPSPHDSERNSNSSLMDNLERAMNQNRNRRNRNVISIPRNRNRRNRNVAGRNTVFMQRESSPKNGGSRSPSPNYVNENTFTFSADPNIDHDETYRPRPLRGRNQGLRNQAETPSKDDSEKDQSRNNSRTPENNFLSAFQHSRRNMRTEIGRFTRLEVDFPVVQENSFSEEFIPGRIQRGGVSLI